MGRPPKIFHPCQSGEINSYLPRHSERSLLSEEPLFLGLPSGAPLSFSEGGVFSRFSLALWHRHFPPVFIPPTGTLLYPFALKFPNSGYDAASTTLRSGGTACVSNAPTKSFNAISVVADVTTAAAKKRLSTSDFT